MPEIGGYNVWDAVAAVGIALSSALVTLGGMLGIRRKNGTTDEDRHDRNSHAIGELKDRYRDLENEVTHLKETIASQAVLIKEAEQKQEAFARLMFEKLDKMNETLVTIRIALGIAERK